MLGLVETKLLSFTLINEVHSQKSTVQMLLFKLGQRLFYLTDEPCSICKHMVVDVSVLHLHGPVLVVSVDHQGQSYRERSRKKDMFLGKNSCYRFHR